MRFGHIELFVADTARARAFYETVLGFALVTEQPGGLVWLQVSEGVEILLRPGKAAPTPDYQQAPAGLVLYTDDVQATAAQLRARGLVFHGTDGAPDCLTFCDPDGHWWQLVNPEHP